MGSSDNSHGQAITDDSAIETDCDTSASPTATATSSRTDTDTDIGNDSDNEESSPPAALRSSCPYELGEKVLAYHTVHLYEAKVLKVDYQKEWKFRVHYIGWNKNWDEWVSEDRLMKYNEENLKKQEALDKKFSMDKFTKAPRISLMKPKVGRGRKRKADSISKEKPEIPSDKLVNIQIPPNLRKQLIDDCEIVTHLGKLVKLPRTPNVDDILKKYREYRLKKDGMISDSVEEILKGLQCYFDKALPAMLLYKTERHQYEEACVGDVSPSTVYGAEHLLRLFVKLPELLFHAEIEDKSLKELQAKLIDFLKFLRKYRSTFFISNYHVPEDIENSTNGQDE